MYKSCSRCGKIHPVGYRCNVGRKRYTYEPTQEKRLRGTEAWKRKSQEVREAAHNLCEVCADQGIYNYRDIEVHHICKLRDRPEGLLDNSNLICLCQKHHKAADRGTVDSDYLRKLAAKREGTPGV